MEKTAYITHGPLEETTRANIRQTAAANSDEEVYVLRKRRLSPAEIRTSPRQGDKTFLLVKDKDKAIEDLQHELQALKARVTLLETSIQSHEEMAKMMNFELYEPILGHRVQAIISLLHLTRDSLDDFARQELRKAGSSFVQQNQLNLDEKGLYFQLLASKGTEPLAQAVENQLLDMFRSQGVEIDSSAINVRRSMRAFKHWKKLRDRGAHVFDFTSADEGVPDRKNWAVIRANVLQDIQLALTNNWLPDPAMKPLFGLLQLQLQYTALSLQRETRSTLQELADMQHTPAIQNSARNKRKGVST